MTFWCSSKVYVYVMGLLYVGTYIHSAIIIGLILLGTYVTYVLCRGKYYVADRMMSLNGTH